MQESETETDQASLAGQGSGGGEAQNKNAVPNYTRSPLLLASRNLHNL